MTNEVSINIDTTEACFILSGSVNTITSNRRLLLSLRRLGYKKEHADTVTIPYEKYQQVAVLKEIQNILQKFNFTSRLSGNTRGEVESFNRDQETFKEFSGKARDIRNSQFDNIPELVREFEEFQNVLGRNLARPLYPLQLLSAYHLAFAQNGCNFSVPGAGKTSIVYGAYAYLKNTPPEDHKHIDNLFVIGPLSSFAPWEDEYEACFGREANVRRLSGDDTISRPQKQQHLYAGRPSELTLISHGGVDNLQREINNFLKNNKTMVVVDEAHRIKNPRGVWGQSIVEITKEAKARVILTGTPVPNGYEDIFNLFRFLYPFNYNEILEFHYENLADMSRNSSPSSERVKKFINNISPFFIRIKKKDLDLPPVREQTIEVEMDDAQREIYDFIETKYVRAFQKNPSGTLKDVLNKAKLIRLRQAATNPSLLTKPIRETLGVDSAEFESRYKISGLPEEYLDDSEILFNISNYSKNNVPAKFLEARNLVSKIISTEREKVIIWTIFIQNAKGLRDVLKRHNIPSKLLIGEVEQRERESIVRKFNDPNNLDFQVVIANPFAVSESISLHKGCHNAIYLERDYNCASFLQSKDRIHRFGLQPTQKTNYYYILSEDSIDQIIDKRLEEKVKRMEEIIDAEIPLFARIDDNDETDVIRTLIEEYVKKSSQI